MSHLDPLLTPELHSHIVSFVRAGGFPHVAAEAAGVPQRLFEKWLRQGSCRKAKAPYRAFADEVRQAAAQARLRAEIALFDNKPLDWLKCGPGKETNRRPGWSAAPKAYAAPRSRDGLSLADPHIQRAFATILEALAPFPDARASVADQQAKFAQSRRPRHPDGGL